MNPKVEELVNIAWTFARAVERNGWDIDHEEDEMRKKFEAALKPGEPVAWAEAEAIAIRPSVENAIEALLADHTLDNATGVAIAVLNAALPAQIPDAKSEYEADVWHEGSQSFYRAKLLRKLTTEEVNAAPTAQTPPRLTNEEVDDMAWQYQSTNKPFLWLGFARAIESAVRKQFLGETK